MPRSGSRTGFRPGRRLLWLNLLALDAPSVAVCWCLVIGQAGQRPPNAWRLSTLFLGVWLGYVGDRLMDARRVPVPRAPRHRFAVGHYRSLLFGFGVALLGALALLARLEPRTLVLQGASLALLGAAFVAYGRLGQDALARWLPRELTVAGLFALAVLVFAGGGRPNTTQAIAGVGLFALAFANCLSISVGEAPWDLARGEHSLARHGRLVERGLEALPALAALLGVLCLGRAPDARAAGLALVLAAAGQFFLHSRPQPRTMTAPWADLLLIAAALAALLLTGTLA